MLGRIHRLVASAALCCDRLVALAERFLYGVLKDVALEAQEPLARVALPADDLIGHEGQSENLRMRVQQRGSRLEATVLEVCKPGG